MANQTTQLLRDQARALHAYNAVAEVPIDKRADYEIAVNDLGATILRSGLCAALANLQRRKASYLLKHLAAADLPGLESPDATTLFAEIRKLDPETYMLVSRELLAVAKWLKRAAQADEGGS